MKAFVFTEKGKIEKRDISDVYLDKADAADRGSVILRPKYLSPCSSDVHTVYAGPGPRRSGLVLGHEGIAEIVEAGPDVKDFKPGELVAVCAVMPEAGDETGHAGMPFSATKLGRNINGMWSEHFKVPEADINLAHLPEGISMKAALMAVDMMATGYTAVYEAGVRSGDTVVVIGSGAVGIMAAAGAKAAGAACVIVIGTDKSGVNYDAASGLGADVYISYRDGRVIYDNRKSADIEQNTAQHPAADSARYPELDLTQYQASYSAQHPAPDSTRYPASDLTQYQASDSGRDPRANSTGSTAVDTVFAVTGGYGADKVLICGGGHDALAQACDMVRYGTGVIVNVAYIEGVGQIGLPIFSLGRGMSGKTFKFALSRGGRDWTEQMLSEAVQRPDAFGALVTHEMEGFDLIPAALELMRQRPAGLIKIMVTV